MPFIHLFFALLCSLLLCLLSLPQKNNHKNKGHLDVVKFLFRVGGGTVANRMNANGDTPLAVAAWEGHLHVVSFLTAVGVELQVKNADGLTAYDVAVMRQHPLIVKFFKDQVLYRVSLKSRLYINQMNHLMRMLLKCGYLSCYCQLSCCNSLSNSLFLFHAVFLYYQRCQGIFNSRAIRPGAQSSLLAASTQSLAIHALMQRDREVQEGKDQQNGNDDDEATKANNHGNNYGAAADAYGKMSAEARAEVVANYVTGSPRKPAAAHSTNQQAGVGSPDGSSKSGSHGGSTSSNGSSPVKRERDDERHVKLSVLTAAAAIAASSTTAAAAAARSENKNGVGDGEEKRDLPPLLPPTNKAAPTPRPMNESATAKLSARISPMEGPAAPPLLRRTLSGSSVIGSGEDQAQKKDTATAGASRSGASNDNNARSPESVAARKGKWDAPLLGRRVVVRGTIVNGSR